MLNRSFQEENLEIDSEVLANVFEECDISNVENKINLIKNLVLNQNKDYFKDTMIPSKIENGAINTQEMSLYMKNLKTSLSNNVLKNILQNEKENHNKKNNNIPEDRSGFKKKVLAVIDQEDN